MKTLFPIRFTDGSETPAGTGGGSTETPPKAKEPVTEVEVDGKVYKVADLVAAARHGAYLEQHVGVMVDPEASDRDRNISMRELLRLKHSEEQVEAMLAQAQEEESTPPQRGGRRAQQEKAREEEGDPVLTQKLAAMEKELEQLRQAQVSGRHRYLQETLNGHIERQVKTGDVAKLVEGVRQVKGDEVANQFLENLKKDAYAEATSRLGVRNKTTGRFDENWLGEAAAEAATELAKRYRPVIVDPSLGRAPETDAGEEAFLSQKPLPTPAYKPGMDPSTVEAQARDWATDLLTRGHIEASREGATKA